MLRLQLLGSTDLSSTEGAVDASGLDEILSQPKRLGLLSYLAMEAPGGHLRRDTLLGLFWPEFESSTRGRASPDVFLHLLAPKPPRTFFPGSSAWRDRPFEMPVLHSGSFRSSLPAGPCRPGEGEREPPKGDDA